VATLKLFPKNTGRLGGVLALMNAAYTRGLPSSKPRNIYQSGIAARYLGSQDIEAPGAFESISRELEQHPELIGQAIVPPLTKKKTVLGEIAQAVFPIFSVFTGGALAAGSQLLKSFAAESKDTAGILLPPQTYGGFTMFDNGFDFDFGDFSMEDLVAESPTFDWTGLLQTGVQAATQFFAPGAVSYPVAQAMPVAAKAAPAIQSLARAGAVVGRRFFDKFPALATAIQTLRNQGKNISRSKLYSLLKRFGPDFLIGIIGASAVQELMLAGPGTRRMNPANSKALRRAARRIKSFHRLCTHTDLIRTHRSRCK
jgi:hypothetical protein